MGAQLDAEGIRKSFGTTEVLKGVTLDIAPGEFVSLLGPSGCGKSTLLRIIAGFAAQTGGTVKIGGRVVDAVPPKARDLAMVFQSYALYPHMTAAENIALPLEMECMTALQRAPLVGRFVPGAGTARDAIDARVTDVAQTVGIDHVLHRRPGELSGGQRQRVALARAIVREPSLFLMDEPLSNLDAKLRVAMRAELVALNKRLGSTVLYVTHDQTEAMTMSDRIALMMGGEIRQFDTPEALYARPAHLDVATFIGQPAINCLTVATGFVVAEADHIDFHLHDVSHAKTFALRPEALTLFAHRPANAAVTLPVRLDRVELLGPEVLLWCRSLRTGAALVAQARAAEHHRLAATADLTGALWLAGDPTGLHLYGQDGSALPTEADDARCGLGAAR